MLKILFLSFLEEKKTFFQLLTDLMFLILQVACIREGEWHRGGRLCLICALLSQVMFVRRGEGLRNVDMEGPCKVKTHVFKVILS